MTNRLPVLKTYKLAIGGKFPRTESGRSIALKDASGEIVAHTCHASRKDLRNAVEAAASAQPKWAGANAYLRGQILYRMAEMLEGKRDELAGAISALGTLTNDAARGEVDQATDRLVCFAGWADKFPQVLGCHTPRPGQRQERVSPSASHREINGLLAAGVSADQQAVLEAGAAENLKRVCVLSADELADDEAMQSPWAIEPFTETKTIWHPAGA